MGGYWKYAGLAQRSACDRATLRMSGYWKNGKIIYETDGDQATLRMGGYWKGVAALAPLHADQATLRMGGYWTMVEEKNLAKTISTICVDGFAEEIFRTQQSSTDEKPNIQKQRTGAICQPG